MGIVIGGLLASSLLVAACAPSPNSPGSGAAKAGGAYGKYVGGSTDASLTIAFTAAAAGITGLKGSVMLLCTEANSSGLPYLVDSVIPLNGMSFSSDKTTHLRANESEELRVSGTLDGSGHASGILRYKLGGVCDSGNSPIKWTASIGGSTNPTTPPSSTACNPHPCSTSDGVTLYVTGLQRIPDPTSPAAYLLAVKFTVTNHAGSDIFLTNQYFVVQPGNGQVVNPPLAGIPLPDGTVCDPSGDLPAGAHSDPQCTAVNLTLAQAAEPLKLIWHISSADVTAGGTLGLSGIAIQ